MLFIPFIGPNACDCDNEKESKPLIELTPENAEAVYRALEAINLAQSRLMDIPTRQRRQTRHD